AALAIFSGNIIFIFAFVAACGPLQTPFHGRGRYGKRHRMTENAERAKLVYFLPQLCYTEL
ncbi:MAG: hypothetical protein KBH55_05280, partial [Faecalibacterium sp.]|nr:hypothetical protein [Faecalibacterium sp.]